jgi:hypothetical protein
MTQTFSKLPALQVPALATQSHSHSNYDIQRNILYALTAKARLIEL